MEAEKMKKLLAGLLSFIIAIAIVELLSRAASVFVHDAEVQRKTEDPWYEYSPDLGWERKPGFDNTFGGVQRSFDDEGLFAGDQSKFSNSTKKKILFVGDSNTFGNDSPVDAIFPSLVDSLLPDAVSFNLGSPGYSSYQGKILLERMLTKLRPNVVVISFNYNDRRYVLHPSDADSKETFQRNYELARRQELIAMLERSYAFRAVRAAVRAFGLISEERILPVHVDSLVARVSPEHYRSNLTEMVIAAQQKGIPVLFLLLGDNPVQTEYLQKGVRQLKAAQPDSAIENLSIAMHEHNMFTTLDRIYLAKALRMKGRTEEERNISIIEHPLWSLHGGDPIYLDGEYQQIMREVGEKLHAEIIDGANRLNSRRSVYYDFCHFDTTGHRMIAELLTASIDPSLRLQR